MMLPLLVALTAPSQAGLPARPAEEVERAAVAARRAIERGAVMLTVDTPLQRGEKVELQTTRRIWIDGPRYRCDFKVRKGGKVTLQSVECLGCEANQTALFYHFPLDSGRSSVVPLRPASEKNTGLVRALDFRLLGMVPATTQTLTDYHLQTVLLYPNRQNTSLKEEEWDGKRCYLVQFTMTAGSKPAMRAWIAPDMNYAVLRMTMQKEEDGVRIETSIESQYRQHGPDKIWFPSRCEFKSWHDGKLNSHETTTVSDVSLNEPLPADTFMLVGLGLPTGTVVRDYRDKGRSFVIRDGDLDERGDSPRVEIPRPVDDTPAARKWLIRGAIALASLALAAFGVYLYRARRASPAA